MIVYLNLLCVSQGSTWGWNEFLFNYHMMLCGCGSTIRYSRAKMTSGSIFGDKREYVLWSVMNVSCNSHVVLLQLERQPAVPLKRKRRYCEFPELHVLSSDVVECSDKYSHTGSHLLSLTLFHSGRLKERTLSSHQTGVSPCDFRLIHSSGECNFDS